VVSDFNATAVAALGGAEEAVLGFGGAAEAPGAAAGAGGGRHDAPGAAGFGATDALPGAPGATDALPGAPGATDALPGATPLGATEGVAGAGAIEATGFGATDALAPGTAALGARDGVAPGPGTAALGARDGVATAGFAKSGGAGIEVSPVAGPGPSGAAGCTGIVVEGMGAASSRQARPSASKLRSVLRPQMGQSHPTSNRFSWASMLCAGARSRTRSRPTAKPART
jgi:hypothetical protein